MAQTYVGIDISNDDFVVAYQTEKELLKTETRKLRKGRLNLWWQCLTYSDNPVFKMTSFNCYRTKTYPL